MNKRLEQFMRSEELTSAKLAEILSVQPSSISHLLAGRNKPNFDFISNLLLMFPNLNPRWIINGEGGMYLSDKPDLNHYDEVPFDSITGVNNDRSSNLSNSYNRLGNNEIRNVTGVNERGSQDNNIGDENLLEFTAVTDMPQAKEVSSTEMFDQFRVEILAEITSILKTQLGELHSKVDERIEEPSLQTTDLVTLDELNSAKDKRIAESKSITQLSRESSETNSLPCAAKVLTQVMLFYSDGTFETLSK